MTLQHVKSLKCLICNKEYPESEVGYVCPDHGNEGILDVVYDYSTIQAQFNKQELAENRDFSIWRYKPLLPVSLESEVPLLAVGWTPLYKATRLSSELNLKELWIKDDGRQATASFKDRASAIAIVKARESSTEIITTASTGNAAAALSGLCASIGQPNVIFVPETAPQAKIAQLLVFGSRVALVQGTYDDAYELCMEAAETFGWYNRNTGFNPYMTEGKKTVAFEICEQLTWQAPDKIFVSVGDGCIIGGVHKGLKDLYQLGWIDKMPQIYGIQAEGSNYLYQAWKNKEDVVIKPPIVAETVADSISAGLPRDRIKALAAVQETNGAYISVTDQEILSAVTSLARGCGVFGEPAGAAAFAGLKKAVNEGLVTHQDSVVVINTGSGLKDIPSALESCKMAKSEPMIIPSKPSNLREMFQDLF